MIELLDDSNLKYWAYRNELYKEENKKLNVILDLIFLKAPLAGKEKMTEWMLPHALEVICRKVSNEMDVMQEVEKLPGLDAITPEFIETWRISGQQEKAPYLFGILLAAAETARFGSGIDVLFMRKHVVSRKYKLQMSRRVAL